MSRTRNTETPKVSIGLPTYNANHKISTALSSVLDQNYPNIEIIISDNCSTDNTREIITNIASTDSRIEYFRQNKNIGAFANFEFVLKKSKGEYFMWLADDDTLQPGIIHEYVDFLNENRDYSLVSGQIKYFHKNRTVYVEKNFTINQNSPMTRVLNYYSKVIYGGLFHGMMRRTLLNKIEIRNTLASDWHIVAQMAYMGKLKNLNSVGYNKQIGGFSKNFHLYAKNISASYFATHFPFLNIGIGTFRLIAYQSDIFNEIGIIKRFFFALIAMLTVLFKHYGIIIPKTLGGKIKHFFRGKKMAMP